MSLLITKPGLLSTIQDLGRFGTQKYGVIASGAMDSFALRMANLLVGNTEKEAGLEITMLGPDLTFDSPAVISVCGGDLSPMLDEIPVPLWRTVYAPKGSRLHFGRLRSGCRAYLAVAGGLDVPLQMNSRSTYLRAGIGGHQGRALRAGDVLPAGALSSRSRRLADRLTGRAGSGAAAASSWFVAPELLPAYSGEPVIRVTEGEEYHLFEGGSLHTFLNEPFTVLTQSDRMGYRLSGGTLRLAEEKEMISSAVTFGTIQVPAGGNPIVLMADRQTTGGYPKLAQVISVDLPLLAQVNLGGAVRFSCVSLREAQELNILRELEISRLRSALSQL
ncbi:biotin-dependent carboxyltransferase family protein [Paenibacillus sp. S150]|uniref:5-oxoprolinase subunit C family protein n=1 Tax=Paenibacillus sp. S150 TaxID=2749826 RepID=UPI002816689B|nr:biotin-dependent carboxyltransferase family protein [Paenibacillus sp. S150]